MDQDTLALVNKRVQLVRGYISQFEDGLITSQEMANATINAFMPINHLVEIDSVGTVDPL